MNYSQIREIDIANGEGIRVSLYTQGCHVRCPGCFNEETWDFHKGKPFTLDIKNKLINLINRPHIQGFTLLGGEPMSIENKDEIDHLLQEIKEKTHKNIWLYSSYTYEVLLKERSHALQYVDVLVDGPFIEHLKDPQLKFCGSSNQRLIDVQKSLQTNSIILHKLKSI